VKRKKSILDKTKAQLERSLARKLGADSISAAKDITQWYPTDCPPIDLLSSGSIGKGLPSGRAVELFGVESVGKTTFGLRCLAKMQELGGLAMIIDTESTFQRKRGIQLGVDVDSLITLSEKYLEPILDAILLIIEDMEGKNTPMLIFWDTIAGTPSKRERSSDIGESSIALHARAMSEGMRRICPLLDNTLITLLACNQKKVGAIGNPYALEQDKDATLGGHALRFHAEVRLKLEKGRKLRKATDKVNGFEVRCTAVKNKNLPDGTYARLAFAMDIGGRYDNALSCLYTLRRWGAMPKGTIKIGSKKLSVEQWRNGYDRDAAFRDEVHKLMEKTYAELFLEEEV